MAVLRKALHFEKENEGGSARRARFLAGLSATVAWAILSLVLLALIPPATAGEPERLLGRNLVYRIPAGYSAVQQSGGVLMVRNADLAQGQITGFLLAVPEIPVDAASAQQIAAVGRATFAQALAITVGNLQADPNAVVGTPARIAASGTETYRLDTSSFDAGASQQRRSRYDIAFVGDVIQMFVATGYGAPARLDAQLPGFAALKASARYVSQGAMAPRGPAAPLPTDLATLMKTPEPQVADRQSGKRCRTVQRQMCSGGIGTSLGTFCNTYPQQVCD